LPKKAQISLLRAYASWRLRRQLKPLRGGFDFSQRIETTQRMFWGIFTGRAETSVLGKNTNGKMINGKIILGDHSRIASLHFS
jgi:hypothetical protein